MLGKKLFTPKLFTSVNLLERIPEHNFYRRLKAKIDLNFLYELTAPFYGETGHPSIDPVVFFKMMLIKRIEGIKSYRALERFCNLRLDILYFLDYDVDELLPTFGTLSKTHNRIGEEAYEKIFNKVLEVCYATGLIAHERIS